MSEDFAVQYRHASKRLLDSFQDFILSHPPSSVNRHLRCILLDYMRTRLDSGLPPDFDVCLEELYDLFELLDYADQEVKSQK